MSTRNSNNTTNNIPPSVGRNPGEGRSTLNRSNPEGKKYKGIPIGINYSNMTQDQREIYFTWTDEERKEYNLMSKQMHRKEAEDFSSVISELQNESDQQLRSISVVDKKVDQILAKLSRQKAEPADRGADKKIDKELKKNDKYRNYVKEKLDNILGGLKERIKLFQDFVPLLWLGLAVIARLIEDWFASFGIDIGEKLNKIYEKAKVGIVALKNFIQGLYNYVKPFLERVYNIIKFLLEPLLKPIKKFLIKKGILKPDTKPLFNKLEPGKTEYIVKSNGEEYKHGSVYLVNDEGKINLVHGTSSKFGKKKPDEIPSEFMGENLSLSSLTERYSPSSQTTQEGSQSGSSPKDVASQGVPTQDVNYVTLNNYYTSNTKNVSSNSRDQLREELNQH